MLKAPKVGTTYHVMTSGTVLGTTVFHYCPTLKDARAKAKQLLASGALWATILKPVEYYRERESK